jgi:hypothetical protein
MQTYQHLPLALCPVSCLWHVSMLIVVCVSRFLHTYILYSMSMLPCLLSLQDGEQGQFTRVSTSAVHRVVVDVVFVSIGPAFTYPDLPGLCPAYYAHLVLLGAKRWSCYIQGFRLSYGIERKLIRWLVGGKREKRGRKREGKGYSWWKRDEAMRKDTIGRHYRE